MCIYIRRISVLSARRRRVFIASGEDLLEHLLYSEIVDGTASQNDHELFQPTQGDFCSGFSSHVGERREQILRSELIFEDPAHFDQHSGSQGIRGLERVD